MPTPNDQPATSSRISAIDGLRGAAALAVLFDHLTLTNSWYANRFDVVYTTPARFFPTHPWVSFQSFVEWSPLHMFYASNAVYIFFVVSGFILVNPVRRFTARAYGLGRMIRLYVPVLAAAVPAVFFALIYGPQVDATPSRWLNLAVEHLQLRHVVGIMWLVDGGLDLNSALWTMRYEVVFSLILPALLWKVSRRSSENWVKYVAIFGLIVASCIGISTGLDLLTYIPVFFVGVILTDLPGPTRGSLWLIVLGVVSMNFGWTLGGFDVRIEPWMFNASTIIGATLVVHGVRSRNIVSRVLSTVPAQFLGQRSYSLYLLQIPVILFVWLCVPANPGLLGQFQLLVLALVIIAVMTEVFYRVVERRAISWSRSTMRRLDVPRESTSASN